MSVVNDALKKAGKGFELNDQGIAPSIQKTSKGPDKKQAAIIAVSIIAIAFVFGSIALWKKTAGSSPSDEFNKATSAVQFTLNSLEQKTAASFIKSHDVMKLSGIVCGGENKWAVVNNKIVKEGDRFSGGEITSITKDLVKIEKKDGSEIVLNLK